MSAWVAITLLIVCVVLGFLAFMSLFTDWTPRAPIIIGACLVMLASGFGFFTVMDKCNYIQDSTNKCVDTSNGGD